MRRRMSTPGGRPPQGISRQPAHAQSGGSMKIFNRLADRFSKVQPLPVGTHHLQARQDEKSFRLHLRLRNDGSGLLILNASTVLHLNPTAAEYAFHFIKGTPPDEIVNQISTRYRVSKLMAIHDYNDFADR